MAKRIALGREGTTDPCTARRCCGEEPRLAGRAGLYVFSVSEPSVTLTS